MSIRYKLQKQRFKNEELFIGRVELNGSYNRDMFIAEMLKKTSFIPRSDFIAMLCCFEQAVREICLKGFKITLDGFCQFTPAISGKYKSEDDRFNRLMHDIYVTAQVSTAFNNSFKTDASLEKVQATVRIPKLLSVHDLASKEINKRITLKNVITITGENLKFNPDTDDEYLKFVNCDEPNNFFVIDKCHKITDKEIVFLCPEISFATGYFELASKLGTRTLRIGQSDLLTVSR